MTRHTTPTRRHAGAAARAAVSSARSTPRRQAGQDPLRLSHGAAQRRWSRWPQGSAATFDESASRQTGHASSLEAAAGSVSTTRAAAGHAATASDEIGAAGSVGGAGAAAAAAAKYRSRRGSHVSPGSAPSGPLAASPRPMRPLGGVRLRLAIRTARRRRAQRHRLQVYATVRTALIWRLSTHASKRSYACEYVLRRQRGCYDCCAHAIWL